MRSMILAVGLLLPMAFGSEHTYPPAGSAYATPDEDFPLHLHVSTASRHYHYENGYLTRVEQTGVANLMVDPVVGIAYSGKCGDGFTHNHGTTWYEARWKKPNEKLQILVLPSGKTKPSVCDLNVKVRPEPYTHADTASDDESS